MSFKNFLCCFFDFFFFSWVLNYSIKLYSLAEVTQVNFECEMKGIFSNIIVNILKDSFKFQFRRSRKNEFSMLFCITDNWSVDSKIGVLLARQQPSIYHKWPTWDGINVNTFLYLSVYEIVELIHHTPF